MEFLMPKEKFHIFSYNQFQKNNSHLCISNSKMTPVLELGKSIGYILKPASQKIQIKNKQKNFGQLNFGIVGIIGFISWLLTKVSQ